MFADQTLGHAEAQALFDEDGVDGATYQEEEVLDNDGLDQETVAILNARIATST